MFVAARGLPEWRVLGLIVAAMIFARCRDDLRQLVDWGWTSAIRGLPNVIV
jgi:hypothetical protein